MSIRDTDVDGERWHELADDCQSESERLQRETGAHADDPTGTVMSETPDIRPRVCMRMSPAELLAARRVVDRGPVVDVIDYADQLHARAECAQRANAQLAEGATHELARELEERGDLIIAIAEHAGIFAALSWWDTPLADLRQGARRASEASA